MLNQNYAPGLMLQNYHNNGYPPGPPGIGMPANFKSVQGAQAAYAPMNVFLNSSTNVQESGTGKRK